MLTDYHTHSYRCGHATRSMEQYIESAIRRGIRPGSPGSLKETPT